MTTAFRTASFPETGGAFITDAMRRIAQPHTAIIDGFELTARPSVPLLNVQLLADAGTNEVDIETAWLSALPDTDIAATNPLEAKALIEKSEQRLRQNNIINYWWALNKVGPDGFTIADRRERHTRQLAVLRDALLPAFFKVHSAGRVLIVSYDPILRAYVPGLNVMRRAQLVGSDKKEILSRIGEGSLSSLGSHGVPDLLHHALMLAFTVFWPKVHGFVASLSYEAFLIFLLADPIEIANEEPSRVFQIEPSLGGFMENAPASYGVLVTGSPAARRHPFDRVTKYAVSDLEAYALIFVGFLDEAVQWITDLSRFPAKGSSATPPDVDLDFALHAYLTLQILIVRSIIVLGGVTAMGRKIGALDVVDLHCGLIDASGSGAAAAFDRLVHRNHSNAVLSPALGRYGGTIGSHLRAALDEIRDLNEKVVKAGIMYGLSAAGVTVLGEKAPITFDAFEARLLRALRNTKHGFAIRDPRVLAMHSGAVDNDFPDYVGALALGLLADRTAYTLLR